MLIRSLEVYYCHFLSLMFNVDGMNNWWNREGKNKGKATEGRRKKEKIEQRQKESWKST